jgi:hypothetical protein
MARFYSCAQAQADGLTTTAGLATSMERNTTTMIRVKQDVALGSKARSCPFLGLHTRGHRVNLDRDTTAGRRAAVRSRRGRERSVPTTQHSVRMTAGTTSGDGQAGCARAVDGSGTCRCKARSKVCTQATAFARQCGVVKPRVKAEKNRCLVTEQTNRTKAGIGTASWEPGIT